MGSCMLPSEERRLSKLLNLRLNLSRAGYLHFYGD